MSQKSKISALATLLGALIVPSALSALVLELPNAARREYEALIPVGSYDLPIAAWADGRLPTLTVEGELSEQAWQIPGSNLTTLQLLSPIRDQLRDAGYEILLDCDTRGCGGFDFRYHTRVLGEPEMHIDLGNFRALTAQSGTGASAEYLSVLISRTAQNGYVQIIHVGPAGSAQTVTSQEPVLTDGGGAPALTFSNTGPMDQQMGAIGRAVLDDLEFKTGSSELADGTYASLDQLATFLQTNPNARVALVGHTDAEGTLDGNINLSRRRAESVLKLLVDEYGIDAAQIQAQGVGYLAPLAGNQTDEGRKMNRRVEAILLNTP